MDEGDDEAEATEADDDEADDETDGEDMSTRMTASALAAATFTMLTI